jgi:hypothetical protein
MITASHYAVIDLGQGWAAGVICLNGAAVRRGAHTRNHQTARRTGSLRRNLEDLEVNLLAGRLDYPFARRRCLTRINDNGRWSGHDLATNSREKTPMSGSAVDLNAPTGLIKHEIEAMEHTRATLVRAWLTCDPSDEYFQADVRRLGAEIRDKEAQLTQLRQAWARAVQREAA